MDESLSSDQTVKVLQFQDLTGIEDITICRDLLNRHQWDLEVAVQEQLNRREGRPSVFAAEAEATPAPVIRDHVQQHVFSDEGENRAVNRPSFFSLFNFVIKIILLFIPNAIFNYFKPDVKRIVTDPLGDVLRFIETYSAKYDRHPVFYQGTYSQALNDAKHELRFLLLYLHSDSSPATQNFCRNTLSDNNVIDYVNQNMLMWGCNVDTPEGYRVCQLVGAGRKFPLLCVVVLRDNRMTIVGRLEGYCSPQVLLNRLTHVFNDNEHHLNRARQDRVERSLTATLRAQQDEAYEESLKADQEKERQKREKLELEEQRLKEEAKKIVEEEERKYELVALKKKMATELPVEPPSSDPDVISILFKLPCGTRLQRRFNCEHKLEDIHNFVFSHPLSPDDFEISTNYPKRILECSGSKKTLAEAGLQNRDVLFINDCNA